ncbi:hypothetical protein PC110_g21666, partial [Phytophthora cactorum]
HASTGFTPFYVNRLANPRVPLTPPRRGCGLSGGGIANRLADISPIAVRKQVDDFVSLRLSVLRQVRDAMAESQDLQRKYADAQGRVFAVFKTKPRSRFIGPFKVAAKKGLVYTLNLPKKMRTHPVFYVGLLKSYQALLRTRSVRLKTQQQIELTLQLINLTLQVDDPVLESARCIEPVHSTVHLLEIFHQVGV